MGGENVKNTILERVLQLVAPDLCFGCGKIGTRLCEYCKNDIVHEPFAGCIVCRQPSLEGICWQHEVAYEAAWVVGDRQGPLEAAINRYKFRYARSAASVLAEVLLERLPLLPRTTQVVPVPTITTHIRQRGYDHAALLARHVAALGGLRFSPIVSRADHHVQVGADRATRAAQVEGIFSVDGHLDASAQFLLIDDVVTTGATLGAASSALRAAGATTVWVAALAHQPLDEKGIFC